MFRDHHINYVYIFDIQQRNKMNEFNFYKIYLTVQSALGIAINLELLSIKGYIEQLTWGAPVKDGPANWPTMLFCAGLVCSLLLPFDCLNREFRFELLYAAW